MTTLGEVSCEFTQVEANNCLLHVDLGVVVCVVRLQVFNFVPDEVQVFRSIEINESSLPELFCMDTRPGKDFVLDLLLPLFKGAEFLIVAVKVLEQFFKSISDVLINPWSVLQLNYEVKSVDHAQMVQALFVFFKVLNTPI